MSSLSTPSSSRSSSFPRTSPNMQQNSIDPSARWLVQKFGGTSIGKFATKISEDIIPYFIYFLWRYDFSSLTCIRNYVSEHRVAIVCSARSGSTKALGTTNLLLRAASEALRSPKHNKASSGSMTPVTRSLFGVGGRQTNGNSSDSNLSSPPDRKSPPSSPTLGLVNGFTPSHEQEGFPVFYATVDLLRQQHLDAARESVCDPEILRELEQEIERDCDWLRNFLLAAMVCCESIFTRFLN